jgi:cell wall-associated NlpC family hydrolase
MIVDAERAAVIAEARTWLRTPFCHDTQLKGFGVDCAQLLIAVYAGVGLIERFRPDYYSENWFLHRDAEVLQDTVARFCQPTEDPRPGDIALFRFGRSRAHAAIVVDFPRIIHADRHSGCVTEDMADPLAALGPRLAGFWTLKRWAVAAHDTERPLEGTACLA